MIKIGELLRKLWSLRSCFNILPPRALTPQGIEGAWSMTWANIGVPSSDVPAEVDSLHMIIERHEMETFSALLAICAGNSPVPGEFPAQRPVTRSFNIFFDLRLNKLLSEQCLGWWFETPLRPLWRHSNAYPRGRTALNCESDYQNFLWNECEKIVCIMTLNFSWLYLSYFL